MTRQQIDLIRALAKLGILGSTRKQVIETLIQRGLENIIISEYPRKYLETIKLLKAKP